jgi:3-oxoacyl-[acyl-carrier-protein] synthase-1
MADECAWVCGVGMMTAVGDSAAQTATSVRAGISRYEESSIYNKRFLPMTMALLPEENLPPLHEELESLTPGLTSRQRRMLRLTGPALNEAIASLASTAKPVPLLLATPEPMPNLPDRPAPASGKFLDHLITQCDTDRIDRGQSKLFPTGRAGGLQALDAAIDMLQSEQHDHVLIGGVDSYLDLYLLGTLDAEGRIKVDGVMDGFAPGEGAGFLLLCSDKGRESQTPKPTVKVHKPGTAQEPGHRYSEEPYKGDGLAEAVTAALEAGLEDEQVRTVLCSMNGESYSPKEWGVSTLRNAASFDDALRLEHPAECFGDIGAAFGPVLIGLAATGMQKGYLAGPCLVWCSSEGADRAAVCVTSEV